MTVLQEFTDTKWNDLWSILKPIFQAGETYPYPQNITKDEAYKIWITNKHKVYVSQINNEITGSYYIKPNQPGLGSHVCNCGYVVSKKHRGKGIATQMCLHSQKTARDLGYKAIQFNLVVSTNKAALHLWKKLGFSIIGSLPLAFKSKNVDYVDAYVMYLTL